MFFSEKITLWTGLNAVTIQKNTFIEDKKLNLSAKKMPQCTCRKN